MGVKVYMNGKGGCLDVIAVLVGIILAVLGIAAAIKFLITGQPLF